MKTCLIAIDRAVETAKPGHSRLWMCLAVAFCLAVLTGARAQTTIAQNNLVQNGGFDSAGANWSYTTGGGTYFYADNGDTILSRGWWDTLGVWQGTGVTVEPGVSYVMTLRARIGQSPLTGVTLSFQDVTTGWTWVTNENFSFPDQTTSWRTFSMFIDSAMLSGLEGHTIGVGISLWENPDTQYGWLHADWVQLAPRIPMVREQPQNTTNYAGASASFTVAAVGAVTNSTGPGSTLQYQWYKAPSTLLVNATDKSLSFGVLDATNAGDYYVTVSNVFGWTQSSNASLVVLPANPPLITRMPVPQSVWVHQLAEFSVEVAGTPPFSYQWKSNTIMIGGATNATLIIPDVNAASATTYSVTVTNRFGSTNAAASLTVLTPAPGSYESAVLDLQPLAYLRMSEAANTNYMANQGTLGTAADSTAEGGYYSTLGPIPPAYPKFEDTNASIMFNGLDSDVLVPPLNISSNTANTVSMTAWIQSYGTQLPYAGIVFERGGAGSGASGLDIHTNGLGQNILAYHWANSYWDFDSGLIITDFQWCFVALVVTPTNATLYLRDANGMFSALNSEPHGTCAFAGNTYVGWDNNGGAADRRFTGLIDEVTIFNRALSPTEINALYSAAVGSPPEIVNQPSGLTNYTGLPFELAVVAGGAPPLSFQWRKAGVVLPGATNWTYAIAKAELTNSGNYDVVVRNSAGTTNSAAVNVLILASAPLFTAPPQAATTWAGVPFTLTAAATGSAPMSYQWFMNGSSMPNQTNSTLVFPDPQAADNAEYVLSVTNSIGYTNSPGVRLTVLDPGQYAQMLYYTNSTGAWTLRTNFAGIQGVWFQTGGKDRLVTHLGYFDLSGAGLLTNHYVGIYQGPPGSGTLLASVEVPQGNTAPYHGGFRWMPLVTPFTLQANTNYVLAASGNDVDPWPDAYIPTWNQAYVGTTAGNTRYVMWDWPYSDWPHEPGSTGQGWGDNHTYGIFNLGAFPMTMQRAGEGFQVNWTLGTLTSSTNVAGPYTIVPGATSPYTLPLSGPGHYYRLQY